MSSCLRTPSPPFVYQVLCDDHYSSVSIPINSFYFTLWVWPTPQSAFTLLGRAFVTRNLYPVPGSRKPERIEALLSLGLRSGWASAQQDGSRQHRVVPGLPSVLLEGPPCFIPKRTSGPETYSKAPGNCLFPHSLAAWNHRRLFCTLIQISNCLNWPMIFTVLNAPVLRLCPSCLERKPNKQT